MRKATLAFLVVIISAGAARAEVDQRTMLLDTTPGLNKQITLNLRAASLREVLDKIQAATGVKLRPDRDIAEDKVTIWVKEKPAKDVLRAIAHCFNLCWAEAEVGSFTYLNLYMDRESSAASRKRNYDDYTSILGQFDTELKPIAGTIRAGVREELPRFDPAAYPNVDVYNRLMVPRIMSRQSAFAAAILQFLKLSDIQRKSLFEGQVVSVSGDPIDNEAKEKYADVKRIAFTIDPSLGGYLLKCSVQPFMTETTWQLVAMVIWDDSRYDKEIQAANDVLAEDSALDKDLPTAKTETKPSSSASVLPPQGVVSAQMGLLARPGEGSAATATTMSDALLPIAEAAQLPIVAQYISEYPNAPSPAPSAKISTRLGDLSKLHKFTVERDGDFLLAKAVLWHRFRDREVPEEKLKRWQRAFTGLPMPTFDALVEMGASSWGQIRGIIANGQFWFGAQDLTILASSEFALKLYASLSPNQQKALWQGVQIPATDLKPDTRLVFTQALENKVRPTYKDAQDPSWPRRAAIAVGEQDAATDELFAATDMRSLDTWTIPTPEMPSLSTDVPEEEAARYYNEQRERLRAQMPDFAKQAAAEIASKHPEVSPKKIGIYAIYRAVVTVTLTGGSSNSYALIYCAKLN